jgi:hypothetical protein
MAFAVTHIRYAVDTSRDQNIKDWDAYISGALYPDSRYVTGVDRRLTHRLENMPPRKKWDDFHRGWAAHIICDNN